MIFGLFSEKDWTKASKKDLAKLTTKVMAYIRRDPETLALYEEARASGVTLGYKFGLTGGTTHARIHWGGTLSNYAIALDPALPPQNIAASLAHELAHFSYFKQNGILTQDSQGALGANPRLFFMMYRMTEADAWARQWRFERVINGEAVPPNFLRDAFGRALLENREVYDVKDATAVLDAAKVVKTWGIRGQILKYRFSLAGLRRPLPYLQGVPDMALEDLLFKTADQQALPIIAQAEAVFKP